MCGTLQTGGQIFHPLQVCSCMPTLSSLQEPLPQYGYQGTDENWYGLLSGTVSSERPNHNNAEEATQRTKAKVECIIFVLAKRIFSLPP